jgi:hypothetical protein
VSSLVYYVFYLLQLTNLLLSRPFHRDDYRTRRDRTERRTEAFEKQMVDITDAYLEWSYMTSAEGGAIPTEAVPVDSGEYSIRVVDTFSEHHDFFPAFYLLSFLQLMKMQNSPFYLRTKPSHPPSFVKAASHQALSRLQFASLFNVSSYIVLLTYDLLISPSKPLSRPFVISIP